MALDSVGTFTAVGWPADLDGATGETRGRTGSGTWKLAAVNDADWPLSFSFHKISGYWDSDVNGGSYGDGLYVSGSRENPHLYRYVGDPDSCELDTFTRTS
ncbi:hypothetical protein [Microtetraspora glauca]|uniref:hypothetical protein n=1 Tax=unclassified Streptomyces TaxID=2593676 RepID=UPI002AA4FBAE